MTSMVMMVGPKVILALPGWGGMYLDLMFNHIITSGFGQIRIIHLIQYLVCHSPIMNVIKNCLTLFKWGLGRNTQQRVIPMNPIAGSFFSPLVHLAVFPRSPIHPLGNYHPAIPVIL